MRHGKLSAAARTAVLCAVGAAVTVGWAAAATLTGMSVSTEGEVTRIHVTLDEPVEFSSFTLKDPARLYVDLKGVDQVGMENLPAGDGLAGPIQASVWKGDAENGLTRLSVDLTKPATPEVRQVEDGLLITLSPGNASEWSLGQAPEPEQEPAQANLTPAEEKFEYTVPTKANYAASYTRTEPAVTSFGTEKKEGLAARGGARVSLDMQNADIYTVLRAISEYSGVNIVMGYDVKKEVKEPLSFHLESVPWGEALEQVLRSAHLWYREDNGIIRVDTEENLRKEELDAGQAARQLEEVMPLSTRIVQVVYANADELKSSVEKSLTKRGMIEVDQRTNSLVVTDIPGRLDSAVEMIQHLDSQTPQVEIVAKLVDVDARYSQDLGILWNLSGLHSTSGASADATVGSDTVVDPGASVHFGLVKSWGTVSAMLSALEQENKANIISNPRITTVNNREARILVGKKIPLIVLDTAGNAVTQLTTIGIALRVTPHINDNNRITLDLHPEVSDLSSQATVQGGVIINTSEADTRVMVGNGETAVIGGLIRANTTTLHRGVPVLKDIPLVGGLFRGSSEVKEKRELLIFVTPRIINSFAADSQGD